MKTRRQSIRPRMMRADKLVTAALIAAVLLAVLAGPANAVRLKDISSISGVRTNQLVGYGLVVGLNGTGDGSNTAFTITSMKNMLDKMGVEVSSSTLRPKNVAAVMVTGTMPVSAKVGSKIDITVSSIGDADSLMGGILLITPMKGVDGRIYSVGQGALTVGGFAATGEAATAQKNIATVGRIPGGATIEREVPFTFNSQDDLTISLSTMDFGTTMQVVESINQSLGGPYARADDISTVQLAIPERFVGNMVPLLASLENLSVSPDSRAKVVVDEKTGTIVLGSDVRLSKVAVAHGNLQIVIAESEEVSQPAPLSEGQTTVTPQTDIQVQEENNQLMLMEGATLQELVDGLNAIGAAPRDLISIIRTLRAAGALYAELEVI